MRIDIFSLQLLTTLFPVPRDTSGMYRTPASPECRVDCEAAPMAVDRPYVNIWLDFTGAET
ncbi:MAG: hypothetical protein KA252_05735 [Sphingorhabdus sp.]|nr:hypothetical protein [Sphingorhabdus sp.]